VGATEDREPPRDREADVRRFDYRTRAADAHRVRGAPARILDPAEHLTRRREIAEDDAVERHDHDDVPRAAVR
jgi:hypothetical protein